jgi:nitrate/nitrite-specific signal transduction histidine kinase
MHERVQLLDGAIRVSSSAGGGTTIEASFPVKRVTAVEAIGQFVAAPRAGG